MSKTRPKHEALLDQLKSKGLLTHPKIESAFRQVQRHHFLPGVALEEVYKDDAVVTHMDPEQGWAISSSSQPTVMALMLEQLQVEPGMTVLEVGTGTGYNAALLAKLTGDPAKVYTIDVDEDICQEARQHHVAAGCAGVNVLCADGWQGYADAAPFDRIIVTASAYDVAVAWFEQLVEGGIVALPWAALFGKQRGLSFHKEKGRLRQENNVCFGFMPMRGEFGWTMGPFGWQWQPQVPASEKAERLRARIQSESWEIDCPPLEEPLQSLDDLQFFLAVEDVRTVITYKPIAENQFYAQFGLADVETESICFLDTEHHRAGVRGWGSAELAEALAGHLQRWLALGRPGPDQLQMTAYPQGQAFPPLQPDERLVSRRWFDYIVSWSAAVR